MKGNLPGGTGARRLATLLTAVVLVAGAGGFYALHQRWHNQVITATSQLGDLAEARAAQTPDLKSIIHEDEKEVVLLDVKNGQGETIGSGFLYNEQGDLITNAHVVGDAVHVEVKMADATVYEGTVIGRSEDLDIALVRVPELAGKQPLPLATDKKVEVGDDVIAFGSPLGLENTVTTGMISGLDRNFAIKPYKYKGVYQITAPITHGNSGGPLVSKTTGEVIGVNAAGAGQGNIGFSIPIADVLTVVQNWSANPSTVATATPSDSAAKAASHLQSDPSAFKTAAIQLLRYFYENIDAHDYVTAYAVLGSDWQGQTPFPAFQKGYSTTMSVTINDVTASDPTGGSVQVTVLLEAKDRLASGADQISRYKLTYTVGFENSNMRLLSGVAVKQ